MSHDFRCREQVYLTERDAAIAERLSRLHNASVEEVIHNALKLVEARGLPVPYGVTPAGRAAVQEWREAEDAMDEAIRRGRAAISKALRVVRGDVGE